MRQIIQYTISEHAPFITHIQTDGFVSSFPLSLNRDGDVLKFGREAGNLKFKRFGLFRVHHVNKVRFKSVTELNGEWQK